MGREWEGAEGKEGRKERLPMRPWMLMYTTANYEELHDKRLTDLSLRKRVLEEI